MHNSELKILNIEGRSRINEIDKDIEQISAQLEFNKRRMKQLTSISEDEIEEASEESPAQLKLKALQSELKHTREYYDLSRRQLKEKLSASSVRPVK